MAAMHEARVAGNGHSEWSLMQPARVKGQGFIVQELPLPLVSSPCAGEPVPLVVSLHFSFQTCRSSANNLQTVDQCTNGCPNT